MRRLFFALALVAAGGAQAVTLGQLLEAAEQGNLDRRISNEQRRKAATDFKAAWTSLFPSLTTQGSWTHNEYKTEIALAPGAPTLVITPSDQFDAVFRLELPLLDTGRWFRAFIAAC